MNLEDDQEWVAGKPTTTFLICGAFDLIFAAVQSGQMENTVVEQDERACLRRMRVHSLTNWGSSPSSIMALLPIDRS